MKRIPLRPAIAMIELIFSIAIMGIVLLSAPMLISTASQSTSVALQQEGINEAASRINLILTYDWDENNINVPCGGDPSILHTTNGDNALKILTGTQRRSGVPVNSNSHSFNCNGGEYNASTIGQEGTNIDDLDDFNDVGLVSVPLGTGGEDYIENPNTTGDTVQIATSIKYINDNAAYSQQFSYNFSFADNPAGTTSIKAMKVTLTSSSPEKELEKEITMYAFSCNIGSYNYARRLLP